MIMPKTKEKQNHSTEKDALMLTLVKTYNQKIGQP